MLMKKSKNPNIQGKLSRAEMKQIMAGSGNCNFQCVDASQCKAAKCGDSCSSFNGKNVCWYNPFG